MPDCRFEAATRRLVREGLEVLGAQVSRKAAAGGNRTRLLMTAEIWEQAARQVHSMADMATLYKEQVDSQIRNLGETIGLSEQVTKKIAGRVGRTWRRQLHLHFRTDSSTLWALLGEALGVRHPRSIMYRSMVRFVLKILNGPRRGMAAWAEQRWLRCRPGSHEAAAQDALSEIGLEVTSL